MNFKRYHVSKNLLFAPTTGATTEPLIVSYTSNSSEFTINKAVTANNVSTSVPCNIVLNPGTYTIKIQGLNTTGLNLDRIYLVDSDNVIIVQNVVNNTSVQFTIAETTTIEKIAFIAAASSVYNNQAAYIMLNEGSTALPYDPYSLEVWHDIPTYKRSVLVWNTDTAYERSDGSWT